MVYEQSSMKKILFIAALIIALTPATSWACACGCGIFDVGTSAMLPTHEGGMAWLEYDFMNQDKNWSGTSRAPGANNNDKDIKTSFFTAGAEYMFGRAWGVEAEVPYWQRHFTTDLGGGDIESFNHSAFGDVRIKGIYSGFSPDMSSGITFGVKLPTGDYTYPHFDRDTEIGTGSTDILLGAYHMGGLAKNWNWFANGELDQPVLTIAGYRPGSEVDAVTGVYYQGWTIGSATIAPIAQILGSYRWRDDGARSNHGDSGYQRIFLSPGLEADMGGFRIYGDVAFPVYQHFNGNQLAASELFKINISHSF